VDLSWSEIIELFGWACAAALLAGVVCPLVGALLYVRRSSFHGIALPQFAAAGVACGFCVLPWWIEHVGLGALDLDAALADTHLATNYHLGWAAVFTFGGLALLSLTGARAGSEVARLAAGFALAGALTVLFTHASPVGEHFVGQLMRGEILAIGQHEFETLCAVLAAVALVLYRYRREFVLISFDRELAQVLGRRTRALELLFLAVTGATVSVGTMTLGPIVLFGLLVLPPIAARATARSMAGFLLWSSVHGTLAAGLGVWAALRFNLPMAPPIVLAAAVQLGAAQGLRLARARRGAGTARQAGPA